MLIVVFFVGLLFNYTKWKQSSSVRTINKIPGPRGYPFLGNLPSIPQESDGMYKTEILLNVILTVLSN